MKENPDYLENNLSFKLANIAIREANKHYHGNCMGSITNLHPMADLFPYTETWTIDSWDTCWCCDFVYYCVILCGYNLPIKPEGDLIYTTKYLRFYCIIYTTSSIALYQ